MYIFTKVLACATLLCSSALAQSPAGFTPGSTTNLGVAFPQFDITVTPGLLVPRPDTINAPTITPPTSAKNTSSYIIFMIDLDVPQTTRVTLLHWFKPDLTLSSSGTLVASANNKSGPGAEYLQPSPPVGDIPHRYTQILFAQPANFSVPSSFASINPPASSTNRIGFSLADFVAAAGLAQPIAANFMTVQNTTGVASGSASSTGPKSTSTSVPFTGAGAALSSGAGFAPLAGLGAFGLGMWLV